jgi:hypothetical protein
MGHGRKNDHSASRDGGIGPGKNARIMAVEEQPDTKPDHQTAAAIPLLRRHCATNSKVGERKQDRPYRQQQMPSCCSNRL